MGDSPKDRLVCTKCHRQIPDPRSYAAGQSGRIKSRNVAIHRADRAAVSCENCKSEQKARCRTEQLLVLSRHRVLENLYRIAELMIRPEPSAKDAAGGNRTPISHRCSAVCWPLYLGGGSSRPCLSLLSSNNKLRAHGLPQSRCDANNTCAYRKTTRIFHLDRYTPLPIVR